METRSDREQPHLPYLGELLTLPVFRGSQVLCGESELGRPVTGVNLSDTPEYDKWLSAGELMVTTCFAIHNNPEALAAFIPTLAERGMAGLCVKPVRYLGTVPQVMIDRARELAFPLIQLTDEVRFADIIKAVSDELFHRQSTLLSGSQLGDDFLLHLLSDKIPDEERERSRALGFGFDLGAHHLVIRARLEERPEAGGKYTGLFQRTLLAGAINELLAGLGLTMHKVRTGGESLLLLSGTMDRQGFSAVSESFPQAVERLNRDYPALRVTAGCGRPYAGLDGLRQSDREAQVALRAAGRSGGLLLFGGLGLLRLLYAGEPEEESAAFVHEILGPLLEREGPKGPELLRTLEIYIRNFGNLRRVSEELFTHYNTVVYRVKSIRELTGLDPHDSDQRFLLELALHLHRYQRR